MSGWLWRGSTRKTIVVGIAAISLLGGTVAGAAPAAQSAKFADLAFERVWQRTDWPVANGAVSRTWFWGPQPGDAKQELYRLSPSGPSKLRQVQYFDKARMEINDPKADPTSPWYVTNGLLTVELLSGEIEGEQKGTPDIPLASDLGDTGAPTYRSFRSVSDVPGNPNNGSKTATGQAATATINRGGEVGSDPSKASLGEPVKYAYYEPATNHNIVGAFWTFLNSTDLVYEGGQTKLRLLSQPWFYATGLPISEAYWARVLIAGQQKDVLIQAFQRRVLTYVPDNPAGWRVQMGNIGQHYYQWRYGGGQPAPIPVPAGKPSGRIAFVSSRDVGPAGGLGIYTISAAGGDVRRVTRTPGYNLTPRFAPNGTSIAYTNITVPPSSPARIEPDSPTLYPGSQLMFTTDTADSVGAPMGATSVAKWDAQADPAYDAKGMFLIFRGKPAGEPAGLFSANLASDAIVIPVKRITTGDWDRQPVMSPDGKQIAFTSGTSADNSQVWVVNADGSGRRRLGDSVSGVHESDPAWSPDGKQLVFVTDRAAGKYDIALMAPDGTLGPALTGGEGTNQRHPNFSPDGKWITFSSDKGGNTEVYVAPADLSSWTNLTNSAALDGQPIWSAR